MWRDVTLGVTSGGVASSSREFEIGAAAAAATAAAAVAAVFVLAVKRA